MWVARQSYWSPEGALESFQNEHILPWNSAYLRVSERVGPHGLMLDLDTGPAPASINGHFEPFERRHSDRLFVRIAMGTEASGASNRLSYTGTDEQFDLLSQLKPFVTLRGDHLLDLSEYVDLRVAATWRMSMSDAVARRVVDAMGGFAAFAEVRELTLTLNGWAQDLVESFCALPELIRIHLLNWSDMDGVQKLVERLQPNSRGVSVLYKGWSYDEVPSAYRKSTDPGVTDGFVSDSSAGLVRKADS